jgi:hypothetical protein
MCKVEKENGK